MKASSVTLPPTHSIGGRRDAPWTVQLNYTFNSFHRISVGSITGIIANTTLLLGGTPALTERTRPWIRVTYMKTDTTPASENGAEINIEETLVLIEKVKSAALEKLNQIRLAFKSQSDVLLRLKVEDDYVEGLRFMLQQDMMKGIPLATITPMFPDAAKLKAARTAMGKSGEIQEGKDGVAVILKLAAAAA